MFSSYKMAVQYQSLWGLSTVDADSIDTITIDTDSITTRAFALQTGFVDGYFLKSDSAGNASWSTPTVNMTGDCNGLSSANVVTKASGDFSVSGGLTSAQSNLASIRCTSNFTGNNGYFANLGVSSLGVGSMGVTSGNISKLTVDNISGFNASFGSMTGIKCSSSNFTGARADINYIYATNVNSASIFVGDVVSSTFITGNEQVTNSVITSLTGANCRLANISTSSITGTFGSFSNMTGAQARLTNVFTTSITGTNGAFSNLTGAFGSFQNLTGSQARLTNIFTTSLTGTNGFITNLGTNNITGVSATFSNFVGDSILTTYCNASVASFIICTGSSGAFDTFKSRAVTVTGNLTNKRPFFSATSFTAFASDSGSCFGVGAGGTVTLPSVSGNAGVWFTIFSNNGTSYIGSGLASIYGVVMNTSGVFSYRSVPNMSTTVTGSVVKLICDGTGWLIESSFGWT